jgi:hypothetical protein
MSGGKGGSTTSTVKIPAWLEEAAQANIRRAEDVAAIGNVPYYGPDVAAMTPMQMSAGQGINTAAGAFGLGTNDLSMGMPAPQTFAGGVQGYSSGNLYDQSLRELQARAPGQYNAITGMFINPQTGAAPLSFGQNVSPIAMPNLPAPVSYGDGDGGGGGGLAFGGGASGTPTTGGFTSIRDMYDGGGPGQSGTTFSGGPLSGLANTIGLPPAPAGYTNIRDRFDGVGPGQSGATFSGGLLSGLSNTVGIPPAKPAPKPAPAPAPKPAPKPAAATKSVTTRQSGR